MELKTYYVIKPMLHQHKKVSYGDGIELTTQQACSLLHGGFISPDKAAALQIKALITENEQLKSAGQKKEPKKTTASKEKTP